MYSVLDVHALNTFEYASFGSVADFCNDWKRDYKNGAPKYWGISWNFGLYGKDETCTSIDFSGLEPEVMQYQLQRQNRV